MTLLSRLTPSDHTLHLLLVATLSATLSAAAILGTQQIRRESRIRKLKDSIPDLADDPSPTEVPLPLFLLIHLT